MKIAVTGAAGFVGSTLCDRLLELGHEVTGIDCFTDYYQRSLKEENLRNARDHDAFNLVEANLLDGRLERVLQDAEVVYHLAAQPGVRASWGSSFDRYVDDNVLATQRLLEALLQTGPSRLVYASSSSVYGDPPSLPTLEDAPKRPLSPYGVTKLAGENLCVLYQESFGLPTLSLRFFTVYGPRQRPDMAFHRFLRAGLEGAALQINGDGTQTRDFTYVDDVIAALVAAATDGTVGLAYNIGGGARWSIRDIIAAVEMVVQRKVAVAYQPVQRGDVRDTHADCTLARNELGFGPATDVLIGLQKEADWLRTIVTAGQS